MFFLVNNVVVIIERVASSSRLDAIFQRGTVSNYPSADVVLIGTQTLTTKLLESSRTVSLLYLNIKSNRLHCVDIMFHVVSDLI